MNAPEVRIRTWVRASEADEATGLLGFLSLTYGDLVLDGVTLRRTTEGRFALSFPARTDRGGKRHPYFRPIDDAARQRIEREILKGLVENQESQP